MSLDGKLFAQAKATLEEKRRQHEELLESRLQKVYADIPFIRELDAQIRATMVELVGVALESNDTVQVEDIRLRNLELQDRRQNEIIRAGFPGKYLDEDYMCPDCHDTGFIHAEMCDCLLEIYKEKQRESLSSLFKLGDETFDSFDLSYYENVSAPETGISPRRNMEIIYETCVEYARKFGKKSMNLFFNGAPGLGKTFLSACIARVVAENGYSVVYDMAASVFTKFEDVQFSRTDNIEEVRSEIKRYLNCDLLIIDDLGTEMTTAFTVASLYEILNTRLVTAQKTIINSNLTPEELHRRYSVQIMSRLEGEYQILTFYGDDIRKKKNIL